jgi:hypothetical protein
MTEVYIKAHKQRRERKSERAELMDRNTEPDGHQMRQKAGGYHPH